jgi:2,5-dioxopentanoate dehydrogenase
MSYKDFSVEKIDKVMATAWDAFHAYRKLSLRHRVAFMNAIADELEQSSDALIQTAMKETNLPEARLRNERGRTIFQLRQYAGACESGEWLETRIDTAVPDKAPAKPDIRKMLIPLGPVVVFGASNFPEMVAGLILKAAEKTNMPEGVFAHVHGTSFEVGKTLVLHPYTKAVGFTGSFTGGKQLFDWANQRTVPIPVFAEMGSVNPVFLLPEKMKTSASEIAGQYAGSITLGVGQFCTNPGLIIGLESEDLKIFIHDLGKAIQKINPAAMLHPGIVRAYKDKKGNALLQEDVHLVAESEKDVQENEGLPTIATTTGQVFLNNPILHQEVFGPYSLVIRCTDLQEMNEVAKKLEGQLTATLMATENDFTNNPELVDAVKNICGRFILNGVPTGVEVCQSMQHGGPFPATTDSRFTSVGADGIKRFARPISYQNWSNDLLPDELKDENPLGIWRTVNGELGK